MGSSIGFGGLASGVQWRDLVDQLVAADRARTVDPVRTQATRATAQKTEWTKFQDLVRKLEDSANALKLGSAFAKFTATAANSGTTNRALLSTTAAQGAQPGAYSVEVLELARAEKISSGTQADPALALGVTGSFQLAGQTVTVEATDSLNTVRDKINARNTGTTATKVSASVLRQGATQHRLIISSDAAGATGTGLTDGGNGTLAALGFTSTQSRSVSPATAAIAAALGITAPPPSTITVDGRSISVDLRVDSLITIVNKINAAGGQAEVLTENVGGQPVSRLSVTGDITATADPGSSDIVAALAPTGGALRTLVRGSDASVRIDGVTVTRSQNTISDALPGVTLSLQQAEPGTTVDVTVARDAEGVTKAMDEFVKAYNDIIAYIDTQQASTQPLGSSSILRTTVSSFTAALRTQVSSLGDLSRGANVGLALERDGKLSLNSTRFREVLAANPNDLTTLFGTTGIGGAVETAARAATQAGTGTISNQIKSIDENVLRLNKRAADLQERVDQRRAALVQQFTQMEAAISRLNAQSSQLSSVVNSLSSAQR
jgi:flagellar hook-associated protein 2